MSQKKATYLVLILLVLLDALYFSGIRNFDESAITDEFGPSYFPMLLSIVLFIFCVISFIKTRRLKDDKKLVIPVPKLLFFTILLTVLFTLSASHFGLFYLQVFLFLFILLMVYRYSLGVNRKLITINFAIALGTTIIFYLIFGVTMTIRF